MERPRTSTFVGVSLDGFLSRLDGSIDWLKPFEGEEHGYGAFFASLESATSFANGIAQLRYRTAS